MKHKICVVTGSRAEYGLLYPLMIEIKKEPNFNLQVIATGMHLCHEFGLTYKEIEDDGFIIDSKVEMLLSSDTPVGITKSIGLAVISLADTFGKLQPDLIIILGDRFEILAVAQAALIAKIPVAHIGGGDITEGSFDDSIRHSITKMSHLHFVTNEQSMQIVRQLGENPNYIFNVGSPGIDHILCLDLMEISLLEKSLQFKLLKKNLLITFHPATLNDKPSSQQFKELLEALDNLGPDVGLIFTKPNADPEGREIIRILDDYVDRHSNAIAYKSLGQLRYYSLIAQVDAVVGNSSSGILEVPSFKKPTVNIGDRQKGRIFATSVIDCKPNKTEILMAIKEAFCKDCSNTVNPYGNGNASKKILSILKSNTDYKSLTRKKFFKVGDEIL